MGRKPSVSAKLAHLASDRPDIAFACKGRSPAVGKRSTVGNEGEKTLIVSTADGAQSRQVTPSEWQTGTLHAPAQQPKDTALPQTRKELCKTVLTCHFALDVTHTSMEW